MKIKKESNDSLAKLSVPWRNIGKGEQVAQKRSADKEAPRFRIAGYVRLSPTGDEREEGSLVSHPQRMQQFVDSKNFQSGGNWGEIVEWYTDKDLSGKDMNRSAFQKMMGDIRAGKINAVIVTETSRLNRKVKDFCEVWEFFKEHKVAFFSLKENFDTSTYMGEMMLIQTMNFAQFERQTIVDRIKKGARARAERGLANGTVLLGFKLVDHRPNHREVDEKEKAIVEFIFRKFLELKRVNPLIKYLNENGYRTKEFISKKGKKIGGSRWTMSSVYSLLTNRAYIGQREVNKKFRALNNDDVSEDDQYFFVDAQWPALISKDLFFDVQRKLEENRKKARKYIHDYRLTGFLECGECGAKLVGKSGRGKTATYFYYGHKRKMLIEGTRHLQRCKVENLPALLLEEAIIGRLKDLSRDRALVTQLAIATNSGSQQDVEHKKALRATKEQERRKLESKVNNLYDAVGEEPDKEVRRDLTQKARDAKALLAQVEMAIVELKEEVERADNVIDITRTMDYIKLFRHGAFDELPVAAQAEVLRERIRKLVVRENGVYAEIFTEKPELIYSHLGGESGPCERDVTPRIGRSQNLTDSKLVQVTYK